MKTHLTILVVEDKVETRESLCNMIESCAESLDVDIHLFEAASGTEAVAIQLLHSIDAVFVDYELNGGMNGCEAITHMIDPFDRLFVVLVSGVPEEDLGAALLQLQSRLRLRFDFAPKPLSLLKVRSCLLMCRDFVRNRSLPYPLADAVEAAKQSANPTQQLLAMERTMELSVKLTVFVMLADLGARGVRALKAPHSLLQMLTLGPWLTLAKELSSAYRNLGENAFAPMIPPMLRDSRAGVLGIVRSFKPVRDGQIHHGFPTDGFDHEALIEEYRESFEHLVSALDPLRNIVWAASERVDMPPGRDFRYSLRVFMGDGGRFDTASLTSADRLDDRRVYGFDGRLQHLALFPFVLWQVCAKCRRGSLFLFHNFQDGKVIHKDVANHEITDPAAGTALIHLNSSLLLPVDSEVSVQNSALPHPQ